MMMSSFYYICLFLIICTIYLYLPGLNFRSKIDHLFYFDGMFLSKLGFPKRPFMFLKKRKRYCVVVLVSIFIFNNKKLDNIPSFSVVEENSLRHRYHENKSKHSLNHSGELKLLENTVVQHPGNSKDALKGENSGKRKSFQNRKWMAYSIESLGF